MKNLSDFELVKELKRHVRIERESTAEVLRYLLEVDERQAFFVGTCTSLYAFCREELGYSEPEAQLRIHAMKLLKVVPDVADKIEQGELSLSVLSKIQSAVARENLAPEEARQLVDECEGTSKRETEKVLATKFPEAPKPEKIRDISEDLVEVRFTLTRAELAEVEALLDKRAHTNFKRSHKVLYMDLVKKERKPDAPQHSPGEVKEKPASRHIPFPTQRFIWQRDNGCCQFEDSTGKKCGSKHGVQIDHIHPYSEGGNHAPENLRLLCGSHNRYRWHTKQAA